MDHQQVSRRAAEQLDRQVDMQRLTGELVEGLGADDRERAAASKRSLVAMTAPPHDAAQVPSMVGIQDSGTGAAPGVVPAGEDLRSAGLRASVVADLFARLQKLIKTYESLPEDDRTTRFSQDAELITGEVARSLTCARARIAAMPAPTPVRMAST